MNWKLDLLPNLTHNSIYIYIILVTSLMTIDSVGKFYIINESKTILKFIPTYNNIIIYIF